MNNVLRKKIGSDAFNKDIKISDDLDHILKKNDRMPICDIRIKFLTIYYTETKVVGANTIYELVN